MGKNYKEGSLESHSNAIFFSKKDEPFSFELVEQNKIHETQTQGVHSIKQNKNEKMKLWKIENHILYIKIEGFSKIDGFDWIED